MPDEAKLRECPFCGSSDVALCSGQQVGHSRDNGLRYVRCRTCGARTTFLSKEAAVSAWNKRAHERAMKVER